jgi:hypothetical protein
LSRLDRLDLEQEGRLYRDPALVKAVLKAAEVPEGPGRIALAIADGDSPPHIVVERDGAFVTCHGAKMAIHEAHPISHAKLQAIQGGGVTVRAAFVLARRSSNSSGRFSGRSRTSACCCRRQTRRARRSSCHEARLRYCAATISRMSWRKSARCLVAIA